MPDEKGQYKAEISVLANESEIRMWYCIILQEIQGVCQIGS